MRTSALTQDELEVQLRRAVRDAQRELDRRGERRNGLNNAQMPRLRIVKVSLTLEMPEHRTVCVTVHEAGELMTTAGAVTEQTGNSDRSAAGGSYLDHRSGASLA